ncbi:hypothetical protein NXY56_005941 [Leishmania guyanensis]
MPGGGSAGNNTEGCAVAFTTTTYGVVNLSLNGLSSALRARRADVVSQRLMFHARSAPSYRIDPSLLGGALDTAGETELNSSPATATVASGSSTSPTTESACNSHSVTMAPLWSLWSVHYPQRHSTHRGTQLNSDPPVMLAAATVVHIVVPLICLCIHVFALMQHFISS